VARRKGDPVMALDLESLAPKCLAEWPNYICNLDIEKQARTIYQLLNLTPFNQQQSAEG
jgi:hypothetical protein